MVLVAPNQEQPMLALDTPSGDAFVNRTWGSSSDWVLKLRDGRRISIPLSLLRSPRGDLEETAMPPVILLSGFDEQRTEGDSETSRGGFEGDWVDDDGDDDTSVVWEDSVLLEEGKELVCVEDNETPMVVTPLAMEVPPEEESYGRELMDKIESEGSWMNFDNSVRFWGLRTRDMRWRL